MKRLIYISPLVLLLGFMQLSLDQELRNMLFQHKISAIAKEPAPAPAKVELGRMLFYDKILSGNKDIACASCHHPTLASGDALSLSIGVGGEGLGSTRLMGKERERIPRNSPEIFNRGSSEWHTMFWDSRVSGNPEIGWYSPADKKLPQVGFDNILAVQAMFPVTSRDEMRGEIGDRDVEGKINELGFISNAMPQSVWHALMQRLLAIPEYIQLFQAAYPGTKTEDLTFVHAANAIAAYEISAFTHLDSPWDEYLQGKEKALTDAQKRGAVYFYREGSCVSCHSGKLMTDQKAHNIGVPQFGPGKEIDQPIDYGHIVESGKSQDLFAFRTPPLRNVALTGPYMHNGAYEDLEEAIRHHLAPAVYLRQYDVEQIPPSLQNTFQNDPALMADIIDHLDPQLNELRVKEREIQDLMAFLHALSEESVLQGVTQAPDRVPSGLPVDE